MVRTNGLSRRSALAALAAAVMPLGSFEAGRLLAADSAEQPAVVNCPDLSGCWNCGYWKSHCNTHHGNLRAVFCKCGCNYEVTWSGTFFKVIPFRYTQTLYVTGCKDGTVFFRASRNLPMFGGTFCMNGSATACKFTAHYTSPKDRGVFVLSR